MPSSTRRTNRASLAVSAIVLFATCTALFGQRPTPPAAKSADTFYYLVFSNPVAGMEDEYNRWYDTQHTQDVVAVPGLTTAQRFVASETQLRQGKLPAKYLIVYKVVTIDLPAVTAEVSRRLETGQTIISPAFDRATSFSVIYKAIGSVVENTVRLSKADSTHTYSQLVFSNPVAGREDEYNTWYETRHLPDMVAVPGFVSGQRLQFAVGRSRPEDFKYEYLVMYTIVTSDLPRVFETYRQRSPQMFISPAFGANAGYTYKAWGPTISGDEIRAARAHR